MAHEIETFTDGTAAAAFGKIPAWHRLGKVFDEEMTAEQALVGAQLANWNVRLATLQAVETYDAPAGVDTDGTLLTEPATRTAQSPDRYATVRTNPVSGGMDILGVGLSAGYHPVQNEEMVEFIDALSDNARISSAGSLRGGTQTFFCCELPRDLLVGGHDLVKHFLAVMNGHDGSMGFRAIISPIRVVCANTQDAALATAVQRWSIRHTKGAAKAIEEARRTLNLSWAYMDAFEKEANRLYDTELTNAKFNEIITQVLGDPKEPGLKPVGVTRRENRIQLAQTIYRSDTTRGIAGTAWGGYQAIAELADHHDSHLDSDRATKRALAAVDGSGVTLKQHAFAAFAAIR
jgi:phage/plasmid-like protein (TIGR03299 family)